MVDLSTVLNIWNTIMMSNAFNFVIFVLILAWVCKKINIGGLIESLQKKIIKTIDDAKKEHEEAKVKLNDAESAVASLPQELDELINDAQKSAEVISKKVLSEAERQIESIENNAVKVIDAEEKLLIANLTKSAAFASVDAAKTNIKNTLADTPTLHEKYINESIDELDRLSL